MTPSPAKRGLLWILLTIAAIPIGLVILWFADARYSDWRYIQPWQKVQRGDSEERVLALLGRPDRVIAEHSDKASWEFEHKVDWYDAESVKQFRYIPFSITGEEYGISFDSSGHAVSKVHITSP